MQTGDGAAVYAGYGTLGNPAYGYGTRRQGLGSQKNRTAGIGNPAEIERKGALIWNCGNI